MDIGASKDERGFIIADRIISAGDGAAAALDILSREKEKELHDFDRP